MHSSSIEPTASDGRSLARYFLLLFCLCLPAWVIGAIFDIELFPGFQLFQAGLAMPMIASLLLTYRERRWTGISALLRRTCDVGNIRPRIWFLPIFIVYPSLGFMNYWIVRGACADVPPPTFSLVSFLGYWVPGRLSAWLARARPIYRAAPGRTYFSTSRWPTSAP